MDLGKWDNGNNKEKKGWIVGAISKKKKDVRLGVKDDLWENKNVPPSEISKWI